MGSFFAKDVPEEEQSVSSMVENQSCRPRSPTVTVQKEILRVKIKMDDDLSKENNAILEVFLKSFTTEMKKNDDLFDRIFNRFFYTGSFYDGLRISMPDEYDINLVLKLPFKADDIEVQFQPQTPSFVKFKIKNPENVSPIYAKILNGDGYLIPEKLRCWFQSVVDKANVYFNCPSSRVQFMKMSASGPARTVILYKDGSGQIDIDLVPVFEYTFKEKPHGMDKRVYDKLQLPLQCFLVPKPYQNPKQPPVNPSEISLLCRTHYPVAERQLIDNMGCLKPVIKLLKLLRDKENWKIIASYYLKTVVMWMVVSNSKADYWKEDKMGDRFVEALEELATSIQNKKIPYLFNSNYNLISKINDDQALNISRRLLYIVKRIKTEPWNIWDFYGIAPTIEPWDN